MRIHQTEISGNQPCSLTNDRHFKDHLYPHHQPYQSLMTQTEVVPETPVTSTN
jgi:hypothetical protein